MYVIPKIRSPSPNFNPETVTGEDPETYRQPVFQQPRDGLQDLGLLRLLDELRQNVLNERFSQFRRQHCQPRFHQLHAYDNQIARR